VAETIDSWANRHYKPFQDANPNIKIVHEQISQRYIETVLTRLSGSSDIDIIGAAPNSTGSFLRSGGALDLTPMIQSDSQMLQIDKFPRWTLDDYTLKRYPDLNVLAGQYGVPLVMFVWQFWHNTDLYNEAGVSVPKRGWTWDDFVSISKKVTDQSKKRYGYQNQNWLLPLWPWVWQNGGDALSEDGKRLTIGSPAVIETFSFLQKLAVEDKLFPAPETTTKEGGSINFDSGATGMITRGNWNLDLSRDWKFKWDISYPPKGKQEATIGEEVGYIISKSTTKKDETWTFVRWTLSPEGQRINAVRDVVPNTDVMKELGLSKVPENVRNVVVPLSGDPMVRAYPQWYRPKYTPDDLQGRLAVLWTGEKKASELLPALEKEFNEALSKPIA
jgi:multiple sugar transport system substrate-binding protein